MNSQDKFNKVLDTSVKIKAVKDVTNSLNKSNGFCGLTYEEICNKVTDIEIEIAKAKDMGLPYEELEKVYNNLLKDREISYNNLIKNMDEERIKKENTNTMYIWLIAICGGIMSIMCLSFLFSLL